MRETLSLLRFHHWKKSFWNGHYAQLIEWWGWRRILPDTWCDLKIKTGARLAVEPKPGTQDEAWRQKYLWLWQEMPTGYRWF